MPAARPTRRTPSTAERAASGYRVLVADDLTPRSGGRMTRRQREQRAYQLVLAGSGAGVVAVAGVVLAVIGIIGWTLPVVAIVVALLCALMFRRTVSGG